MVQLIPGNTNPTRADIDVYLLQSRNYESHHHDIKYAIREIECKSNAGALLHPSEEYFLEQAASL